MIGLEFLPESLSSLTSLNTYSLGFVLQWPQLFSHLLPVSFSSIRTLNSGMYHALSLDDLMSLHNLHFHSYDDGLKFVALTQIIS